VSAARRLVAALALAADLAGCGGGGHHHGVASVLTCAGAASPAVDEVALECPASASGSLTVTVVLGGPTASTDIYEIDFDLLFDPVVLRFNGASANGSFLAAGGMTVIIAAGPASNDPGRLVVAVARQGTVSGVGGPNASQTVVTLSFSGMSAGTTALTFDNATALDSSGTAISGITFGAAASVTFTQ
jgi:hypothetical protein